MRFAGTHAFGQLLVHQAQANLVFTGVKQLVEPIQFTKDVQGACDEMQWNTRVTIFKPPHGGQ